MITNFISYIKNKKNQYIIFDIGSRDCAQSIEFYHAFPNAKIYAFECNPNTIPICKKNIENYLDRITLIEAAICDYDGEITFYPIDQQKTITTWEDGNPGASSLFKSNNTYTIETYVQNEIITNCHRLDTIMKKYNIPLVDIIWMDLQGAELMALKGLGSFLNNVQFIHTEVSYKEIYSGQVMYEELNEFITDNDFSIKNNLSLSGWQEDIIYQNNHVNDLHSIIINGYYVIIDCFRSVKNNSLVIILNNRDNIFKYCNIDINSIKYILNGEEIFFQRPSIKDYNHLDGFNHRNGIFKNNFHIEVLYMPLPKEISEFNELQIIINSDLYTFDICPPCLDFIENKCITTIYNDNEHLIKQWVHYHKKIGFEKFILYYNGLNMAHINIDGVKIIKANWNYWDNDSSGILSSIGQVIQQNHCLWKYCPNFLGLIDLDEYINPHNFNIFNKANSVLSIPNYFFNKLEYRESVNNDGSTCPHFRKCIINATQVDLFCTHIPINFKNIYYAKYSEVQLNHYNLNKNIEYPIFDNSINSPLFDIVIPIGANDLDIIYNQIKYTKQNIIGYRNIYLISAYTLKIEGCTIISEKDFPFVLNDVAKYHGKSSRNGWYLQQLLKLYAGSVIPNILNKYLVIDADTFFVKPTAFYDNDTPLYNYGTEYHIPYFIHMSKLHPNLQKIDMDKSGICHHMMFEQKYIIELFKMVEDYHNNEELFYEIFLKNVTDYEHSGASEYEIYFNYMQYKNPTQIKLRPLIWENSIDLTNKLTNDYISCHWHLQTKNNKPHYISFKKLGRTGNNLFQYMFCKLICLQTDYQYIPLEELNDDIPYIIIYENDLHAILQKYLDGELKNINLICEGFFQKSDYYIPYREQLLEIIYTTDEYWIDEGNKKYIKNFIEIPSHIRFDDNDIVIHIRLDDFKHGHYMPTTDILPPSYYINILKKWETPINNIYIICDKIRYNWEDSYIQHFNEFNPILIQSSLLKDIAIIRDCPNLIHSNSTLCWIISFFSKTKKIRYIPYTYFFNESKLISIENNDVYNKIFPLLHSEISEDEILENKISRIFYINLNKRLDRREQIERQLAEYITPYMNIIYERFEAIETPNFGILGCGKSHLAVLKLAKERRYNNVLILEDDFTFIVSKEDFKNELNAFFSLKIDYDVCMLSYLLEESEECEYSTLYKIIYATAASGYIVNYSYYDTLIELYESAMIELENTKMHWVYANDQIWKTLQKKDKWYGLKNKIGVQSIGYSDTSNTYRDHTI